jgi:hypothetical protein
MNRFDVAIGDGDGELRIFQGDTVVDRYCFLLHSFRSFLFLSLIFPSFSSFSIVEAGEQLGLR